MLQKPNYGVYGISFKQMHVCVTLRRPVCVCVRERVTLFGVQPRTTTKVASNSVCFRIRFDFLAI